MKKKYVLGSVLVTLLMLVTAISTINTIADPSQHTGDAWVGELWITELDVSSELNNVENIGIGHVTADDDWVLWTEGTGNIKANWTVDIDERSHPEYCIMFTLVAINIDDNNVSMANDTMMKTYEEDRTYDDSGTLALSIEFTEDFMNTTDETTLVCYLNTYVRINDTNEATNFTVWSMDRCVVGVCFDSEGSEQPFSRFTEEANDNYPNIWSWMPGWNESNRFDDEDDMLETHTYVKVGESSSYGSSGWNWDLGDLDIEVYPFGITTSDFDPENMQKYVEWDPNKEIDMNTYIDYEITNHYAIFPRVLIRYMVVIESGKFDLTDRTKYPPGTGTVGLSFTITEDDDIGLENYLVANGYVWTGRGVFYHIETLGLRDIIVTGDEGSSATLIAEPSCYWEDSVAYYNESYEVDASNSTSLGVTTVHIDISDILQYSDECVHIYAGDVGEERVVLSV